MTASGYGAPLALPDRLRPIREAQAPPYRHRPPRGQLPVLTDATLAATAAATTTANERAARGRETPAVAVEAKEPDGDALPGTATPPSRCPNFTAFYDAADMNSLKTSWQKWGGGHSISP